MSSTQDFLDVEEEDYDVVEVKTIPTSPKRHSINNDKNVDKSVYDVPRPKMSRTMRKSQSTFNLNLRTSEEKPGFKRQPPLPSPRKVYLSESQDVAPHLPEKTPADVSKRLLFIDDHCSAENCSKTCSQPYIKNIRTLQFSYFHNLSFHQTFVKKRKSYI